MGQTANKPGQLSPGEILEIETRLSVRISDPVSPVRCINQQFGIYEMNEHIGDVMAEDRYFGADELVEKIGKLFPS